MLYNWKTICETASHMYQENIVTGDRRAIWSGPNDKVYTVNYDWLENAKGENAFIVGEKEKEFVKCKIQIL